MNEYNEYIRLRVSYFKYKPLETAASRRAKKFYEGHIPGNLSVDVGIGLQEKKKELKR